MIGLHFRDPVNNWPNAVSKLSARTPVKFFWTEGAREAKLANPNVTTIRRHHVDHQDPYLFATDKEQAAREFFNTFIDGTFLQYADSFDYIEELNEYSSHTNPPDNLAEKIQWAIACAKVWHNEYRIRPELSHIRLIVGNVAIGNDWGTNGWKVAQACIQYDAAMGYHPYIPTRNGLAHPDEWYNYSGRWESMDANWRDFGYSVDWIFTEGGSIGYDLRQDGGIGSLLANDGWRHPNVCNGNLESVKTILGNWCNRVAETVAYNEGRVLGVTLFDSGFSGWEWFQYKDQNLQDIAEWSGTYMPIPEPEPIPIPEPRIWSKTVYLLPQDSTLTEYDSVRDLAYPTRSEIAFSADSAFARPNNVTSHRVIVYTPERWGGKEAIEKFVSENYQYEPATVIEYADFSDNEWIWPVDNPRKTLNYPFGEQRDYGLHEGVDLYAQLNDNVMTMQDGIVTWASNKRRSNPSQLSDYGYHVVVDHLNEYVSWYCHLDSLGVNVGDILTKGDVVGKAGNTGNSSGVHLHLNIQHIGHGLSGYVLSDVIDPWPLIVT